MKIRKIRIKNFKCFKDETASDLGGFVGFVGVNNSGKSSLFQLLKSIKSLTFGNESYAGLLNLSNESDKPIELFLTIDNEIAGDPNKLTDYAIIIKPNGDTLVKIDKDNPINDLSVLKNIFEKIFFFDSIRKYEIAAPMGRLELMDDAKNLPATISRALKLNSSERDELVKYVKNLTGARISMDGKPNETIYLNYGDFKTPLLESGTGIMQQIILAIKLLDLEEYKHDIIFIDDPEVYLHPTAQKSLFELIKKQISKSNKQVFVATHSPYFADLSNYFNYRIISITRSGSKIRNPKINDNLIESKKYFEERKTFIFSPPSTRSEMLFSKLVIIVEGPGEKHSLSLIFDKVDKNFNLYKSGVSIIDAEGKTGIPALLYICKVFNIPYLILYDTD